MRAQEPINPLDQSLLSAYNRNSQQRSIPKIHLHTAYQEHK